MTAHMAKLKQMAKKEGLDVEFVSFSVDPEVDTPEKLAAYAKQFTDDLSNWHLLTGYSPAEISELAQKSFKTIVQKPANDDQVVHGTSFIWSGQTEKWFRRTAACKMCHTKQF